MNEWILLYITKLCFIIIALLKRQINNSFIHSFIYFQVSSKLHRDIAYGMIIIGSEITNWVHSLKIILCDFNLNYWF